MFKPNFLFEPNALKQNLASFIGAFCLSFSAMLSSSVILTSSAMAADDVALAANHPNSYVVKKGDTLWAISGVFLQNPWEWPRIWHVNPEICNPNLIYPGDTVNLSVVDGKAQLDVKRANPCSGTVKMSPSAGGDNRMDPRIRIVPLEAPIPAIPLDIIDPFLSGSRVVDGGVLEAAPYILAGVEKHVVTGAGDSVNARGEFDPKVPTYGIYRKGKIFTDDETGEILGIEALDIGTGKVIKAEGDIVKMDILRSTKEVLGGDRLLANEERPIDAIFYPSPPSSDIEGKIINIEGGVQEFGAMNVVLVNKGKRELLEVGNVLAIFQEGETMKDPVTGETIKLINERAGILMIFNVFEKTSFGLVLESTVPLKLGAMVKKP